MILPKIWLKHSNNQDKVNDFLRKEIQTAVNQLLEAELTAFLGYDPYAKSGLKKQTLWPVLSFCTSCLN